MEELGSGTYVPLSKFDIEPSLNDKFWEEKVKRSIKDSTSVKELREIATLLVTIATQRQGVIKGLVKDMHVFNNVVVDPADITNPEIKP
tara:strand:+ start:120 stop:386 length:267 start_codon:yes stop_codon:yes gene_type:complete